MFHYYLHFELDSQSTLPSINIYLILVHKKLFNRTNSQKKKCVFFCLGLCKAVTVYELSKAI